MEEFTILPSYMKEQTDINHLSHTISPYKYLGNLINNVEFNYYSVIGIFEKIFLFFIW